MEAQNITFDEVLAIALNVCWNRSIAEELAQTAWIRAFENNVSGPEIFGWLKTVIIRLWMDMKKSHAYSKSTPFDYKDKYNDGDRPQPQIAETDMSMSMLIVESELSGLRADIQDALHYKMSGAGYSDIARDMGVPVGTVKSRLNRATKIAVKHLRANERNTPWKPVISTRSPSSCTHARYARCA